MTDSNFLPSMYGRYILLHKIAMGGMAEVFRAKSFGAEDVEKLIAIKRLYPHLSEDPGFVQMFINEARLAATLNHVNVAPIYDFGCQQGLYYIAMEYVRGCDLADLIVRCRSRRQQMPLGLTIWLLIEICNGLDYAHRKHDDLGHFLNLIHRDVTPQNILISYEGEVKITDFGIAKVQMLDRDETTGGLLKGKFSYMSPEQVRGDRLDHRSDIFSLGIVAWELLTYQKMFEGQNDYHILEKVREAQFVSPRQINPQLPPDLDTILSKALTRHPEDRYQSVGQMRLELLRFLSHTRLFPSRTHLSSFVRKLFEDKLIKESEDLVEETSLARRIWSIYREEKALLEGNDPNPQEIASGGAWIPQIEAQAPQSSPQQPGATIPPPSFSRPAVSSLAHGLSDWEDDALLEEDEPTLPDISAHSNMANSLKQDQYNPPTSLPIHQEPAAPRIVGSPVPMPVFPSLLNQGRVPFIPQPILPPRISTNDTSTSTNQPWNDDELDVAPSPYRQRTAWIVGISTFVIGLILVFILVHWFSPRRILPTHEISPPKPGSPHPPLSR